jgi:hypothetical protein
MKKKERNFWVFKRPNFKFPKFSMPKFNQPRLRLNWKWIFIIVFILALSGGGYGVYRGINNVPPEEAVNSAIENTLNAESYRYQAVSKKIIDGKEDLLSEVQGAKSNGNVHITGRLHVVNSDFEIYQVADKLYRRDEFSKDWLVVEDNNVEATERLVQEINPLGIFKFSEPIVAQYVGKEDVNGKKCRKYEVMAETENKYLLVLWKDFTYTVWIDKAGLLTKAEINAVNKQHENQRLSMSVVFSDYNKEIVITPPM